MSPFEAFVIMCAFATFLLGGAWLLEETERGRRFADRALVWLDR